MVNAVLTEAREAERALALSYAPAAERPALSALLALDALLGGILRSTREPLVGQMRLTWWREALGALDERPSPAEPVLTALAKEVLPRGVRGADLALMVDGWEVLLVEPLEEDGIRTFAAARGAGLFRLAGQAFGAGDSILTTAGEGWALADLAVNLSDPRVSRRARALATERLDAAFTVRWSAAARPLGALALLARADLKGWAAGSPLRVARLLRHRLTGR